MLTSEILADELQRILELKRNMPERVPVHCSVCQRVFQVDPTAEHDGLCDSCREEREAEREERERIARDRREEQRAFQRTVLEIQRENGDWD